MVRARVDKLLAISKMMTWYVTRDDDYRSPVVRACTATASTSATVGSTATKSARCGSPLVGRGVGQPPSASARLRPKPRAHPRHDQRALGISAALVRGLDLSAQLRAALASCSRSKFACPLREAGWPPLNDQGAARRHAGRACFRNRQVTTSSLPLGKRSGLGARLGDVKSAR